MKIAWGITGAGHYLRDSVKIIEELVKKHHIVDVFFSAAGETVARMYNVLDSVETLHRSSPKYLHSIIYDKNQTPGYPICAHFNLHRYELLIISPLTANSVGKMNVGIADTLITNIFSQMLKGNGVIYVVPCDLIAGEIETEIPSGDHIKIHVDSFNSQNAQGLRKFNNVHIFEHPTQMLKQISDMK